MRRVMIACLAIIALCATMATARLASPLHSVKFQAAPSPYQTEHPTIYSSRQFSFNGAGYQNITAAEFLPVWTKNPTVFVVDVREVDEYQTKHIKYANNFPLSTLEYTWKNIPTDQPIYVHCLGGVRSLKAINLLISLGYKNPEIWNISDGFKAWTGPTDPETTVTKPELTSFQAYVEAIYAMGIAERPSSTQQPKQQQQQTKHKHPFRGVLSRMVAP